MATATSVPTPRQVEVSRAALLDLHAAAVIALGDLVTAAQQVDDDTVAMLADAARRTRAGQALDDDATFTGLPAPLDRDSWVVDLDGRRLAVTGHLPARLAAGVLADTLTAARVHPTTGQPLTTERVAGWARP